METKEIIALILIVIGLVFNIWLAFHNPWKKTPTKSGQFSHVDIESLGTNFSLTYDKYKQELFLNGIYCPHEFKEIEGFFHLGIPDLTHGEMAVAKTPSECMFLLKSVIDTYVTRAILSTTPPTEQSVILKKMDEIANTFPHPRIKGDLIWNPERTAVTFIRSPEGRYILGCDPVTPKSFDGSKRKYFEHDEQAFIPHPYPSDLI